MMEIEELLKKVKVLSLQQEEKNRSTGENFNVFKLCGVNHYENSHSDIIAEFLNPKGSHGCGNDFLLAFCRVVGLDALQYENADVDVTRERKILEGNGRVDIIIEAKPNKIIIENKIYANEGERQLQKYRDWLDNNSGKKAPLFFLTLDGRKSNDGNMNIDHQYTPISYKSHIMDWLKICIGIAAEKPFVRESLIQYRNLVEDLLNKGSAMNIDKSMIDVITGNFESAIKVAQSIDMTKAYLLATRLTKELKNAEFSVREDADGNEEESVNKIITGSGPDYNVIYSDPSKQFEIELGFDHYYFWGSRTLLRFSNFKKEDIEENIEKIKSSKLSNCSILKASNWKIENSQNSLTFWNHDNTIALNDETFKGLANESSREDTIKKILENYQARKDDAIKLAGAVLDFLGPQK